MNKVLSPTALAVVGLVLFGQGFVFQGVLIDMLKILGLILIIVGLIGIFKKKKI